MKAEKIPMASTASVMVNALERRKKFAIPDTKSMTAPTKSNRPIALRSRWITDDSTAMPRKMPAVPAKACITRLVPSVSPMTEPITRDSRIPMKKVKAKSMGTPAATFLVFSMA
ncbi:hypothetical protein D3C87_1629310 [compost metagenome]